MAPMAQVNPRYKNSSPSKGGSRKVTRTRQRAVKKSLPTWAILGIFAVGILMVVQVFSNYADSSKEEAFDAQTSHGRITLALENGDSKLAKDELAKVKRNDDKLTSEWRKTFAALRVKSKGLSGMGSKKLDNMVGTQFLRRRLDKYESGWLVKKPVRARARIYVERAQYFISTWPDHPNTAEVRNKLNRWKDVADLASPANLEDVLWETKTLTWAFPRDYATALPMLTAFRASASEGDATVIDGVLITHKSERDEYFADRFEQAAYLWDRSEVSKAIEYLVQLTIKIGDPAMADQAARALVAFHGQLAQDGKTIIKINETMHAYKINRSAVFELLKNNSTCRAFFQEHGLL